MVLTDMVILMPVAVAVAVIGAHPRVPVEVVEVVLVVITPGVLLLLPVLIILVEAVAEMLVEAMPDHPDRLPLQVRAVTVVLQVEPEATVVAVVHLVAVAVAC